VRGTLTSLDVTARTAKVAVSPGKNRRILAEILGGDWPDATKLADLGYDDIPSKAGLASAIRVRNVPVSPAAIIACDTVGCVKTEMNRVRPEWS
jgi:hypothetical protein